MEEAQHPQNMQAGVTTGVNESFVVGMNADVASRETPTWQSNNVFSVHVSAP